LTRPAAPAGAPRDNGERGLPEFLFDWRFDSRARWPDPNIPYPLPGSGHCFERSAVTVYGSSAIDDISDDRAALCGVHRHR
jgi:hypothetical protein